MNSLDANDLKTKGISVIEKYLKSDGKVAMAVQEVKADIAAGRFVTESVADHMSRFIDS